MPTNHHFLTDGATTILTKMVYCSRCRQTESAVSVLLK